MRATATYVKPAFEFTVAAQFHDHYFVEAEANEVEWLTVFFFVLHLE